MQIEEYADRSGLTPCRARGLAEAKSCLYFYIEYLEIDPGLMDIALPIYIGAMERGLIRGRRGILEMAGAALYAAIRENPNVARNLRDVSEAVRKRGGLCDEKKLARYYRAILDELNIKIGLGRPDPYLKIISRRFKMDKKTYSVARAILKEAKRRRFVVGKKPEGVAGIVAYIASCKTGVKETRRMSQESVAEVVGVTSETIKKGCKRLGNSMADYIGNL